MKGGFSSAAKYSGVLVSWCEIVSSCRRVTILPGTTKPSTKLKLYNRACDLFLYVRGRAPGFLRDTKRMICPVDDVQNGFGPELGSHVLHQREIGEGVAGALD